MKKKREKVKRRGGEPHIPTTDLTTGFMRCLKFISPSDLLMLYEDQEIQGKERPYQQQRGGTAASGGREPGGGLLSRGQSKQDGKLGPLN